MKPQVTFRGLDPSADIVLFVHKKAKKLGEVVPLLRACHVVIEPAEHGAARALSYRVSLVLSGAPTAQGRIARHAVHANIHVGLNEVFRTARRQLGERSAHPRSDSMIARARAVA